MVIYDEFWVFPVIACVTYMKAFKCDLKPWIWRPEDLLAKLKVISFWQDWNTANWPTTEITVNAGIRECKLIFRELFRINCGHWRTSSADIVGYYRISAAEGKRLTDMINHKIARIILNFDCKCIISSWNEWNSPGFNSWKSVESFKIASCNNVSSSIFHVHHFGTSVGTCFTQWLLVRFSKKPIFQNDRTLKICSFLETGLGQQRNQVHVAINKTSSRCHSCTLEISDQ